MRWHNIDINTNTLIIKLELIQTYVHPPMGIRFFIKKSEIHNSKRVIFKRWWSTVQQWFTTCEW